MDQPVAIITGAGRGIGRATASELIKSGYRVVLVSRSAGELEETARVSGGGLVAPADVCDIAAVDAVVERATKEYGRVDALVHNAGLAPLRPIDRLTPQQWRDTIDTNLSAAYYFCRALWPIWQRQHGGVAVLVSSIAARTPMMGFTAYGAAKAGLNTFGLALAMEGQGIGVRVHVVGPGAVETAMLRGVLSHEQLPTERALAPSDVASVIAQCVRGELRHTSGEVIYVHKTL
jgi:3-oxoacyl-[acyl-carrier protein] reductase